MMTNHPTSERIEDPVAERPVHPGVGLSAPRTNHHIEPLFEQLQHWRNVRGAMLPVSIHKNQDWTSRFPGARLYRSTVTLRVDMRYDSSTCAGRNVRGLISRAIVHDKHLNAWMEPKNVFHQRTDGSGLIFGGNNHCNYTVRYHNRSMLQPTLTLPLITGSGFNSFDV
jgi:hypothetical protein